MAHYGQMENLVFQDCSKMDEKSIRAKEKKEKKIFLSKLVELRNLYARLYGYDRQQLIKKIDELL